MISVLCVDDVTNYSLIPDLDLWNRQRDVYNYIGNNMVIAHPPCPQWSKLRHLKHVKKDQREKDLAMFCLEIVKKNGGIFEHPKDSSFFDHAGIIPTIEVQQSWWGFPAPKATWLYFVGCEPATLPKIRSNGWTTVNDMKGGTRSKCTIQFCKWLCHSVDSKYELDYFDTL